MSTVTNSISLPVSFTYSDNGTTKTITADAYKIWAAISTNDPGGLTIENILPGDQVIIYDASGLASFSASHVDLIKGVIGIANMIGGVVVIAATDGAATPFVEAWNKSVSKLGDAFPGTKGNKNRDAYGQDPGGDLSDGNYAKEEGGIIVCMPEANGTLYATPDTYLADGAKKNGRLPAYFSKKVKDCNSFFLSNKPGGQMQATATKSGHVHILAFDSDFSDNQGVYNIGVVVVRAASVVNANSIVGELLKAEPNQM